jgi:hypothetical protein
MQAARRPRVVIAVAHFAQAESRVRLLSEAFDAKGSLVLATRPDRPRQPN